MAHRPGGNSRALQCRTFSRGGCILQVCNIEPSRFHRGKICNIPVGIYDSLFELVDANKSENNNENSREFDKCSDDSTFLKLFDEYKDDLISNLKNRLISSNFRSSNMDRLFLEMQSLYLPIVKK